jgi:hypothetical protein
MGRFIRKKNDRLPLELGLDAKNGQAAIAYIRRLVNGEDVDAGRILQALALTVVELDKRTKAQP